MNEKDKRMLEFLVYIEDYYYTDGDSWFNHKGDSVSKEEILKEFKHLFGG
jgi:hypothetical protein